MATTSQLDLQPVAGQMEKRVMSEMQMLQLALENHAAIDVIERIAALVKDARLQQAEEEFNERMTAAQAEIEKVVPDLKNTQTNKKYESYEALDDAVRPVYIKHGFSLSFSFAQPFEPGNVRLICHVSRGLHTRIVQGTDYPTDGLGPKGNPVLNKSDATSGASSRGRRQLLKMIFNIVIAEDPRMDQGEFRERLGHFSKCRTISELFEHFKNCFEEAETAGDIRAQIEFSAAKDKRKKEIEDARAKS